MPAPPLDSHPELPLDPDAEGLPPVHCRFRLMLVVAAGGAIGASLRYTLARALSAAPLVVLRYGESRCKP